MKKGRHIPTLASSIVPLLMKIAKYIGDLIFDYECVVIPEFGGFISTEKSAVINKVTNQFIPPSKDIIFNVHLKANDGLLVNYVAQHEGISFEKAKIKVDRFSLLCRKAVDDGERINFNNIGYIFRDEQENIVFIQDKTVNFNADAFGLSSFVSPAIKRTNSEEKIKEVFSKKVKKDDKRNPRNISGKRKDRRAPSEAGIIERSPTSGKLIVKRSLVFVLLILFAFSAYYGVNNRHEMLNYWDNNKAKIPLLYNNPNDYLVANAGNLPLEKVDVNQASWVSSLFDFNKKDAVYKMATYKPADNSILEDLPTENKNAEIVEEVVDDEVVVVETVNKEPSQDAIIEPEIESVTVKETVSKVSIVKQNRIFIIAGSFKSKANAEKLVVSLKNDGYDAAVADTNSSGMFRVAYMSFGTISEAKSSLIAVRRESNPNAWILKK